MNLKSLLAAVVAALLLSAPAANAGIHNAWMRHLGLGWSDGYHAADACRGCDNHWYGHGAGHSNHWQSAPAQRPTPMVAPPKPIMATSHSTPAAARALKPELIPARPIPNPVEAERRSKRSSRYGR